MGEEALRQVMAGIAVNAAMRPSSLRESRKTKRSSMFAKKGFEKCPAPGTQKGVLIEGVFFIGPRQRGVARTALNRQPKEGYRIHTPTEAAANR